MKRHQRIINSLGLLLLNYDSGHRAKHIAAVVNKNKIVSIGYNTMKTSPAVLKYSRTHDRTCIHAEVDALGKALETKNLDLYVVRIDRNGDFAMSCPCRDCMNAIDESSVRRVIYTTGKGYNVVLRRELEPYYRTLRSTS